MLFTRLDQGLPCFGHPGKIKVTVGTVLMVGTIETICTVGTVGTVCMIGKVGTGKTCLGLWDMYGTQILTLAQ